MDVQDILRQNWSHGMACINQFVIENSWYFWLFGQLFWIRIYWRSGMHELLHRTVSKKKYSLIQKVCRGGFFQKLCIRYEICFNRVKGHHKMCQICWINRASSFASFACFFTDYFWFFFLQHTSYSLDWVEFRRTQSRNFFYIFMFCS